jgi:YVTN family beta-propeller protein
MSADRGNTGSTINPRRSIAAVTAAALAWLLAPAPVLALNAYITNYSSNTVSGIDTATNTVIATVPVGRAPYGVAVTPDGSRVYVTNNVDSSVSVIATATNMVIGSPIPVGPSPLGVAVTPDGSRAYVANIESDTVTVINTTTNTVVPPPIPVGPRPVGVAVTPDGSKVYVGNLGNFDPSCGPVPCKPGTLSVISTVSNTVIKTIPVGSLPQGVAVTPDGSRVYVAGYLASDVGAVWVIDTATDTVITLVTVGNNPRGVAVSPEGSKVYVSISASFFSEDYRPRALR